jgi:hydrogenase maturation factor
LGIVIEEGKLPIREEVTEACEISALIKLHVANEGKMVAVVNKMGRMPFSSHEDKPLGRWPAS